MVDEKNDIGLLPKVDVFKLIHLALGLISFMIFLSSCQQSDSSVDAQGQSMPHLQAAPYASITFLDSLSDTLKPQRIWLKDHLKPIVKYLPRHPSEVSTFRDETNQIQTVYFPQIIQRPYLKNEKGEAVLDPEGNYYYLGDGGISHFSTFTTDEGLGLDNITSSLLDRSGNIWFGTWGGGISKFDGVTFTNFTTAHGLSNNLIHCLAEDAEGNIWIGTEGGGISIYDGYTFTIKTKSDGLANDVVYGITPDSKGNIWIAAGNGGASKYDGDGFVNFNKENGLEANSIIKIAEDNNGFIWFGTGNNGLSRFDGDTFLHYTIEDGLAENTIHCITQDQKGNLWFGTEGGGVSMYQESTDLTKKGKFTSFTVADGLGHNTIWDIKEDLQGNIWFATGGNGVSKYDGKKFTSYTTAQGLPEDVVYSISVDGSGNIWFGTAGGGVALYKGAAFTNFTPEIGLAKNGVYGILEDKDGDFWFGTDGGGISKYDGKSFTNYTTDQGLPNLLVICSAKDQNGNLWFGTGGGGLVLYREKSERSEKPSFTTFNSKNSLPNDIVYTIKEDRFGNIWIGTSGGGLVKFDWNKMPQGQASFTVYTTDQGLVNNTVYSLHEDKKGNLWIGTGGGGISKFDGKSFTNFTSAQGLTNDIIWSIMEDQVGNLWFGTQGGGVSIFDGESFRSFTKKEGLVDDTVYDLLEDKKGNIFIGTNRGFTVIPSDVATFSFDALRNKLEFYNTSNGYPVKDVNKGIFLDSSGKIWAGNGSDKTGLVKFDYQALRKRNKKPSIKIKNISLYENPISWISLKNSKDESLTDSSKNLANITNEVTVFGRALSFKERKNQRKEFSKIQFSEVRKFENFPENLELPYAQNQISIDFGTDELVRPNLIEYKYFLQGYNKNWSPVVKASSATFGNLREGDYLFRVIARYTGPAEGQGKEWSEEAVYSFSILPPLHRTWWAYLIYFIILLVGIKRVHVFQKSKTIRRERERNQQKELEQAKEIEKAYHELQLTQAQLIQQEKLASLGQLTAGIAHEIKNPLNFVNNFSEVSIEMIDEALGEIEKQEAKDEKLIKCTLEDIKSNLEKINDHGTRANEIVSSMLQHSRSEPGEKELTNLNSLIMEYVNFSFQGMRSGKNSIDVEIIFDFDTEVKEVSLIKADFSKVVINLCNNAFDAMRTKVQSKDLPGFENLAGLNNYQPKLTVITKSEKGQIQIAIKDNGLGIPNAIKDKIFQPFFTTKKGTEGTGLGLSISHDIIKAHGGELKVESKENIGTNFYIYLKK